MSRMSAFPWIEAACVAAGLAVTAASVASAFGVAALSFLAAPSAGAGAEILAGVLLAAGLALGVRRHHDVAPVLFGAVGFVFVVVGRHLLQHLPLIALGGGGILLACAWTVLLRGGIAMKPSSGVPTLEEYLDAPLRE